MSLLPITIMQHKQLYDSDHDRPTCFGSDVACCMLPADKTVPVAIFNKIKCVRVRYDVPISYVANRHLYLVGLVTRHTCVFAEKRQSTSRPPEKKMLTGPASN